MKLGRFKLREMVPEAFQEIIDGLALLEDRQDRVEALLALGDEYMAKPKPDVPRDAQHRVPACESEVYMNAVPAGEGLKFQFAVDNPQGISAMALAEIIDQGLSGQPLGQVADVSEEVVYKIFGRELSMGKSAGLIGMIQMVKSAAAKASS
jgi:cysteine desulfuration protein SufE